MLESSPITILIIDDSPVNLHVLSKLMRQLGWHILSTTSGEAGIRAVEEKLPDIILLDILMPGIDGFEVCRQLKNNPKTKHIPIILMSALTDTESTIKGLECGAVDYICKPFKQQEVIARLNAQIKLHKTNQILAEKNLALEVQIEANEKIKQELIQSETNFSIAFNHSPDYILIHGYQGGVIMDANERFCRLINLTKEQLVGLSFLDLSLWVNPDQYQQFYQQEIRQAEKQIRCLQTWELNHYALKVHRFGTG